MASVSSVTAMTRLRGLVRRWRGGSSATAPQAFATGSFYSPVVDTSVVLSEPDVGRIWRAEVVDPPGIDLRPAAQLELLAELGQHRMPDPTGPGPRYDPANDQFPPQDAALLYALVRHLRPRRM